MKEDWERPELIVIVKTELAEDVLAGCKGEPGTNNPCTEASGFAPGSS